ncbi:hypothetical protein [Streptomyces sp. NBC_00470]|uniref:hypothetical protein n=1 Tax=Streptomyces sp. NBC_00470 TaxID=2975753 RepID=UPI0030DE78DA
MKVHHVLAVVCLGACVASAVGARRAAGSGSEVPAAAVGYHGAMELYRNLAVFFGKRALEAEARYWEVVRHG